MKKYLLILASASIIVSCSDSKKAPLQFEKIKVNYPETRMGDVADDYHGTTIQDPYRWLEDDNSDETKSWVVDQNKSTFDYLDNIKYRKDIKERLESLWDYAKYSSPFKEGDTYYYYKNDGLQNQYVLYGSKDIKAEGEVVLDPNKFSEDGTSSLAGISFDKSGRYLAYLVSEGGSDWRTGYIKDLETGELLEEKIEWVKFSGFSWRKDGFFYSRFPEPKEGGELSQSNSHHSLYYHKLGDPQSKDKLIYVDNDHPMRNIYAGTTEDERYLIMNTTESTSGNALSYIDLDKNPNKIVPIVTNFDSDYSYIDNDGENLLLTTNNEAPKKKVIS